MANIVKADQVNTTQLNAAKTTTGSMTAGSVSAGSISTSGGGSITTSVLTCQTIILGGFTITAQGDGLYVTTPGGIQTKIELIDPRQVPVPPESDEAILST